MQYYRQFRTGINVIDFVRTDFPVVNTVLENPNKDFYTSIYKYNEEQHEQFLATKSVKGIDDVVTDILLWDFDDKNNLELAQKDAKILVNRLMVEHDIPVENIRICFSGNKGFHVEVRHDTNLTVQEFKNITRQIAMGLETYDSRINDHARAVRIIGSYHEKSGLYKIPLTFEELKNLSPEAIRLKAKDTKSIPRENFAAKTLKFFPNSLSKLKNVKSSLKEVVEKQDLKAIPWSEKPRWISNCRWALMKGHFEEGDRNTSLLVLASSLKNQGMDEDDVYRLCKSAAQKQVKIEKSKGNIVERYPDNEIYNNIVMQVFKDGWNNGQYTCRDKGNWLYRYCQKLGNHKCANGGEDDELKPMKIHQLADSFSEYVMNIENNTVLTGIPSLDKKIFLSTGANVGVIGAPGSGKTSLMLDIAENTSKKGVRSVLASLDMHKNRFFEKALYRVSGLDRETLYKAFKDGKGGEIVKQVHDSFGNVDFFHKSCPTVNDLREYIIQCNNDGGPKVKLVMVDYFERVVSDLSDDTAASKRVAGELQDLVNDLNICLINLVQPNKMSLSGGPDTPILSYTAIKGSSYLYQSFRIILSLWRPFYTADNFDDDHYMQMAVLKNDLGELAKLAFGWEGKRGLIKELTQEQLTMFEDLLKAKEGAANAKSGFKPLGS